MGISSFIFATTPGPWPEFANCTMEIDGAGKIMVRAGIAELGQGSRTALAQIAAQALGIPLEHCHVRPSGDTAVDQDSLQTVVLARHHHGRQRHHPGGQGSPQTLLEMAADLMEVPLEPGGAEQTANSVSIDGGEDRSRRRMSCCIATSADGA